ncbi:hypothetical protein ACIBK9_18165 [Nonomuraea sp. NPDC050227]
MTEKKTTAWVRHMMVEVDYEADQVVRVVTLPEEIRPPDRV